LQQPRDHGTRGPNCGLIRRGTPSAEAVEFESRILRHLTSTNARQILPDHAQ